MIEGLFNQNVINLHDSVVSVLSNRSSIMCGSELE